MCRAARPLLVVSLLFVLALGGAKAQGGSSRGAWPWGVWVRAKEGLPGQGPSRAASPSPGRAAHPARKPRPLSAEEAAQAFFRAVHAGRYQEAYNFLAPAVREDLSFEDFETHSRNVLSVKVLQMVATERSRNLVRFRVKGRLRIRHEGQLFDAVYGGQASMTRTGERWSIDEVELKPLEQRPVKKGVPGYQI